ncbi:glycosyltransferase [Vibrio metoecus]|nr:glycosyltransferase [Vibrio metoecus]
MEQRGRDSTHYCRCHTNYYKGFMNEMTQQQNPNEKRSEWSVPSMNVSFWKGREHRYCVVIPVINEGQRIKSLLQRMENHNISNQADIIIADGGSTDGSLDQVELEQLGVSGLIVKLGEGKLSAQLRCAYSFALEQGYEGIVTIDGNDKDDPEAIPHFLEALDSGIDFVQGSRFIPGGTAVNTPKVRDLAIRYVHAPLLSIASGFKWTDTTQGFRGYSRKMLLDPKIAPFRDIFCSYELLAYLSYRAPKVGLVCKELPTNRTYPEGEVPTKISRIKGNFKVLSILVAACLSRFDPK